MKCVSSWPASGRACSHPCRPAVRRPRQFWSRSRSFGGGRGCVQPAHPVPVHPSTPKKPIVPKETASPARTDLSEHIAYDRTLCNQRPEDCRTALVLQPGWTSMDAGGRRGARDLHRRTLVDVRGRGSEDYGSEGIRSSWPSRLLIRTYLSSDAVWRSAY